MNRVNGLIRPVVILGGLLLAMPMAAVADKPAPGAKGGKPNQNSVAITAACTFDDGTTARVCSCKGLSNVVLWCGETWVKHEDFGSDGVTGEVFDTTVGCVDGDGNAIPGPITLIAIKSGSEKHVKHQSEDYATVVDDPPPPGSGLFVKPEACSSGEFACPAAGDCKGDDEPPADEPPDEEDPPILG